MSMESADFGIVVAGHGSRDADGLREFESLVALLKRRAAGLPIAHGYLEFAAPTIDAAVRAVLETGVSRVALVPGVLFAARHAKNDLPSELLALQREFPERPLRFGAPLGLHPSLLQLARERIVAAEAGSARVVNRSHSCLVVVGRGTTDPDANSEVCKLARMLEEGMGFGASFVCYAGTAKPLVAEGLRSAARLGFSRLVVLPYFLFDGVLVKRIFAAADGLAAREPIEVLKARHLGVHEAVADALVERAHEALGGAAAMNCALCKYRVQIVGFESQVGEPQRAHHVRARGILAGPPPASVPRPDPYRPHAIEAESLRIIEAGRDWSAFPPGHLTVLKRLVHTTGDFSVPDDIFFSPGAVDAGIRALLRVKRVVTDVTMVQTGLKRELLERLEVETWCGVHDRETALLAEYCGLTRSAASIRRAWQQFGNEAVVAIGDAPTAVAETVRLIREQGWRPQLVIGLPVGFVGTRESKDALRRCLQVPRITNSGTRGGSPWAASAVNALLIDAINQLASHELP